MTTDKAFKRVVRARMAKTGERYAVARRTLVEGATDRHHAESTADAATPSGYRMRGGLHPETATLANVLANQGVVSGMTGEPLTEAAILGIGGGLGAGYILWEFKRHGSPVLTLGFRNQWQYPCDPRLDGEDARPARHRTRRARDRRRQGRHGGARWTARRWGAGYRLGGPAGDRDLGSARRDVGLRRPGRRRVRTR